jgi:hypothetical protein
MMQLNDKMLFNLRLKTDVESARLKARSIRHGLAA